MKLKVLRLFRDKFDPKKSYQPGTEVNFDDEARCNDLIRRGLCEAVNDPKKAEAPAEETPEVPAEEPEKAEAPAEENPAEETPAEEKESEAKAPKSGTAKKGSKK